MTMFRTRVVRADGRAINVMQRRAHLSYCFTGCCCGRTERGDAAVTLRIGGFFRDAFPHLIALVDRAVVYRSRVVNPKWLDSIRRHGYKGGLERSVPGGGHG